MAERLLIYEPLCGGHRPDFVRHLADALRRSPRGGATRFALGRGFLDAEPELKARLLSLAPAVEVAEAPPGGDRPAALRRAIHDFQPDCVLLFELTKWENALCGRRLPCDLAGILFVQYPEIDWRAASGADRWIRRARRIAKEIKLSLWIRRQSVRAVFLLHGGRAAGILNRRFPDRAVFRAVPDPAPPPAASPDGRAGTGRPGREDEGTGPVRLLFPGSVSGRKGIFRLIEALERVSTETGRRAEFRILGAVEAGDRARFSRAVGALRERRPDLLLVVEDRRAPEPEFQAALAAADWILMPYLRTEYSSGILVRAAAAGVPVLGPADGLLGSLISEWSLGRTCAVLPRALARALDAAAAGPMRLDGARRAAFLDRCRGEEFAGRLLGAADSA